MLLRNMYVTKYKTFCYDIVKIFVLIKKILQFTTLLLNKANKKIYNSYYHIKYYHSLILKC